MKVYLPSDSKINIGGGWRFRENFIKGASQILGMEVVDSFDDADISLIAGATMILPETFTKLKQKKVVLRLDGVPEAWRNSGRTWGRFKHYFSLSDGVVCQSEFVAKTTFTWLHKVTRDCPIWCVIMNGVDEDIFTKKGSKYPRFGNPSILHINSRKDENKRIEEVIARYRVEKLMNPELRLIFAGKYPTYLIENQFGLYDYKKDTDWKYFGVLEKPELIAKLMRSCDEFWFPSFADPCPNVVIEAIHTMGVEKIKYINSFGGAKEIIKLYNNGYDFSLKNMANRYYHFLTEVLNEEERP